MKNNSKDSAIVGMACIFPGAPDLAHYWHNLTQGVDSITDVPEERWQKEFYDPESTAVDRFYCKRGGFVDDYADFDALGFGVMPVAAQGAEPDQLLALQIAAHALSDAGYDTREFARERTGVILGRGNYIGAGMTRLEQHVRTAEQLVSCLKDLLPNLPSEELARVKTEFQSRIGNYGPDTAIGLVPNLTASRIANRLDLQGPAYTVDAACASSLLAVDQAVRDLHDGRADMMLAGGVHLSHDVAFWSVFCQLGALSRKQQICPFDQNADGILIGEGLGVIVLKRLADAIRDDDRIYAVIKGTGVSSDGREASLMMPSSGGQVQAVQQAWTRAGIDPASVGLIEAHGTGTPVGDTAELETLATVFGQANGAPRAVLGSVKSMIGHAMPAAGIAGIIKAALAVHQGVLLPSLHCKVPHPKLADTRFRVISEAEPWVCDGPRRAGVNAFGFGGINAHVVLESHGTALPEGFDLIPGADSEQTLEELLLLAATDTTALIEQLQAKLANQAPVVGSGPVRLALINPTQERLSKALSVVQKGASRRGRDGLWFAQEGLLAEGKLGFLFPGVEAGFEPRVQDLARWLGVEVHESLSPLDTELSDEQQLERTGMGVVTLARMLNQAFARLGIEAQVMAGHSIGEWSAMVESQMIPPEVASDFISSLAPGSLQVPGVVFVAAGAGVEKVAPHLEGLTEIAISHDNCPHQVIICGREESADVLISRLTENRILCQKLPFKSGFHSPLFSDFLKPHQDNLSTLTLQTPRVPLWSATTGTPYPSEASEIRTLAAEHLLKPVAFRQLIEAMYDDGVRAFVQLGCGSLTGFVSDTLRGQSHLSMSANVTQRSGLNQLQRVAAALFVEGMDADLSPLHKTERAPSLLRLSLGVPLVRLDTRLSGVSSPAAGNVASDPVVAEFQALMGDIECAGNEVYQAWKDSAQDTPSPTQGLSSPPVQQTVTYSVDSHPHLMDHCFFRQAAGSSSVAERYPVVPMTMTLQAMIDVALSMASPASVAVGMSAIRAYKWLAVWPQAEVEITSKLVGKGRIHVSVHGYAEGVVHVADSFESAPQVSEVALDNETEISITAEELYSDRWMFHGPAYQGVSELTAICDQGIRGSIITTSAPGALLDNAGQLFGFWVMQNTEINRLAMPVKVDSIVFYGPHPEVGEILECRVQVNHLAAREVRCDMVLHRHDTIWATISGWEDWRFETDERLWPLMRYPERHLYGEIAEQGYCMVRSNTRTAASLDYLSRRFLCEAERTQYDAVGERRQPAWLMGR
ncbi:MAG TPA: acyltransferase domain-containing protein [Myxococcales bacterium]|nr:acyltransferase domain-containing protein [Myxococcales bacterium]